MERRRIRLRGEFVCGSSSVRRCPGWMLIAPHPEKQVCATRDSPDLCVTQRLFCKKRYTVRR